MDSFFGLQTLHKNLVLSFRCLLLVSRLCVFTVFNLNEVYLPHVDIGLLKSACIFAGFLLC